MSVKLTDKKKRSRFHVLWKRWGDWRKLVIALGTGLFIAVLLTIQLMPDQVSVQTNQIAMRDIVAPRAVQYRDELMTRRLRQLAASTVQPTKSAVANADVEAWQTVDDFFQKAETIRASSPDPQHVSTEALQKHLPGLRPELARLAVTLAPGALTAARVEAQSLVRAAMGEEIPPEALEGARENARQRAARLKQNPSVSKLVGSVVALSLTPNRYYNERDTQEARQREMDRVPVQYATIRRGDLVVRKGDKVTPEQMTALVALGLVKGQIDAASVSSLILLAFGLVGVFCLYVYQFHPRVLRDFSQLLLISLVVCGSLLIFRVSTTALGLRFSVDQLGFIGTLCSSLGAMLIAALICPQVAVFVGVALALLTSVLVGGDLKFAILSIVSSLVAVQSVTTIRNRAGILRTGVVLSLADVVTALVAHGATHVNLPGDPNQMTQMVTWAVISGFSSVLMFVIFAAGLERMFGLSTHLTLLELSDPSHPLLRRLAMEAPGTYHHSVIVGNLAEAAAEAIGADGLFCRVASYYHDVGKVIRPQFFVENQSTDNRHDTINPSLSSLVIAQHVKDGVELAEEHRLPPPIIAIIREHHGTCLIKYFYHQAVTSGEDNTPALEYQFRYEGPRPQTKESGIIMLADSAEAASRTLEKPTPGRIRDLIERIVRDRLSDNQLDDCELTFKDLERIISSMTRSLTSVLHARVEYPVTDTSELRRLAADGAARKESVATGQALSDIPETASAALGSGSGL